MMNAISKRLCTIIAAVIVIGGCIYSGRVEYNDAVLSGMSESKYEYIKSRLSASATPEDVVREYTLNRKYYDSIEP